MKKAELDEKNVFEMYYEYEEPVKKIVPHRTLALNRGEKEDILKVSIQVPIDKVTNVMKAQWILNHTSSDAVEHVEMAIEDSYKRLIQPSVEREIRAELNGKSRSSSNSYFLRKST